MKKFIFLVALSALVLLVSAQSQKHEFYITAGIGSGPFLVESLNNMDFFSTEPSKDQATPIITIGYQYRLSKKFKLGPEIILDKFWIEDKENKYHFTSFLCRLSFIWFEKKKVTLYSGLSAGITFKRALETMNGVITSRKGIYPGIHIYTIGFDYKLGKFSITLNNGIGMSGLINLGMKYRF